MFIVVGVVAAVVGAGAAVWAVVEHSSAYDPSRDGCVSLTIPSTMGGGIEHACGTAAQDWCRAVSTRHDTHALAVQTECRKAGILP
jgi:hypothetical protein